MWHSVVYMVFPSPLPLWSYGSYFNEYFENEEARAQKSDAVSPRSHSLNMVD